MRLTPPKFIKRLLPSLEWRIDSEDSIYITFDDGPTPGITEWILSVLKQYDAQATFFMLGRNVEMYPELYKKIVDAGHRVGNHTYSHLRGINYSLERYVEDTEFAENLIKSDLFRPPYGLIKPAQARFLSQRYRMIMWDVLSRDYSQQISPKTCARSVIKYMRPGSIVVFHDSVKAFRNMSYALPIILRKAKEMGLHCRVIE